MPTAEEWRGSIAVVATKRPKTLRALTYHKLKWGTYSKPVLLECDDENLYVVKGIQVGRAIVTDHVLGILGRAIRAPVPNVSQVDVPSELIKSEKDLKHMTPGVAHGSRWVERHNSLRLRRELLRE